MSDIPLSKRISHQIEYAVMRGVLALCSVVPIGALRRFGAGLGWVTFRIFGIRRRVAIENIRRAFPDYDEATAYRVGLHSYMNFGRTMLEFLGFSQLTREKINNMVTVEGAEHFAAARQHGRGAVLVTGHFGNWELFGAAVARLGYAIHGADTNHANKRVHELIVGLRASQGVQVLTSDDPASLFQDIIRRNEFVAYIADQDARRHGVFVDFLGTPASTVRGPAIFAIRQKCPMIAGFIVREGNGRHRGVMEAPIWPDPTLRGPDAVRELTQRFTTRLGEFVRRHPEQYFWAHRRWKSKPPR